MLILIASQKEAAAVERAEFGYRRIYSKPFEVWKNDTRVLIITGIGLVNASLAFSWAVDNIDFDKALNIGAAGATSALENSKELCGRFFKIAKVNCLEPYNFGELELAGEGASLVTSSRPVSTQKQREYAGKFGQLVDMEGYAIARAAELFGKKLEMIKMLTDFSENCDISENITLLRDRLADCEGIWI